MTMYSIRYRIDSTDRSLHGLTWWCRAGADEELLYSIKSCLAKYPSAVIEITSSDDIEHENRT
jgi:hypothetical protein